MDNIKKYWIQLVIWILDMNTAEITAYHSDANITSYNIKYPDVRSIKIHSWQMQNTTLLSFFIRKVTIFFNSFHNLFITSNSVQKFLKTVVITDVKQHLAYPDNVT